MNRLKSVFVLGCSILAFAGSVAHGATAAKHRVTVTCTCEDAAGKAYAEALHAALAQSSQYREVSQKEAADQGAIRINIVSLALEEVDGKARAALSIVCLHDGAIMHQFVETCLRIPIDQCAKSMVSDLADWES